MVKNLKEMTAAIVMGSMASGKTTIAKKLCKEKNLHYLNPDLFWDRNKEEFTPDRLIDNFAKVYAEIFKDIRKGKSFLVDTASAKRISRQSFCMTVRGIAHGNQYPYNNINVIGFYVQTNLENCLKRNRERGEKRPDEFIKEYFNYFQKEPPEKELDGFDKFYIINNDNRISNNFYKSLSF